MIARNYLVLIACIILQSLCFRVLASNNYRLFCGKEVPTIIEVQHLLTIDKNGVLGTFPEVRRFAFRNNYRRSIEACEQVGLSHLSELVFNMSKFTSEPVEDHIYFNTLGLTTQKIYNSNADTLTITKEVTAKDPEAIKLRNSLYYKEIEGHLMYKTSFLKLDSPGRYFHTMCFEANIIEKTSREESIADWTVRKCREIYGEQFCPREDKPTKDWGPWLPRQCFAEKVIIP